VKLVSHTKGLTQIEGVWVHGAVENIWIEEGGTGDRLKMTA